MIVQNAKSFDINCNGYKEINISVCI